MDSTMERRKVFLDVGAHHGESVCRFFRAVGAIDYWTWRVHCFEPNPACFAELLKNHGKIKNISFHNMALTGRMPQGQNHRDFYIGEKHSGEGSTMLLGKRTGHVDYEHPVKVPAEPLAAFIENTFGPSLPSDCIVMKLNIEGGEYEIMQHILDEGIINRFDQIYIQTHKHKLDPNDYAQYADLEVRFIEEAQREAVQVIYCHNEVTQFKPNTNQTRKATV